MVSRRNNDRLGSNQELVQPVKTINTLVEDVYNYLDGNAKVTKERVKALSDQLAKTITEELTNGNKQTELRMSNFGTKCERQLWYRINTPADAEPLDGKSRLNFLLGHILEDVQLFLIEESGHRVEGRQDELEINGLKGHRDAVIDGVLVDVKSTSSRQFEKFRNHELERDDPFGYLTQINLYSTASKEDPLVTVKGEHAFVAINKEFGSLAVDKYKVDKERDFSAELDEKRRLLDSPTPPVRGFNPIPDGKSGNEQLPVPCRYCPFKSKCHPGLRTFQYSNGKRYLTKVVREPDVREVTSEA